MKRRRKGSMTRSEGGEGIEEEKRGKRKKRREDG